MTDTASKPKIDPGFKRGTLVKLKSTGECGRVIRCSIPGSAKHRYDVILAPTIHPGQPTRTVDVAQDEIELC